MKRITLHKNIEERVISLWFAFKCFRAGLRRSNNSQQSNIRKVVSHGATTLQTKLLHYMIIYSGIDRNLPHDLLQQNRPSYTTRPFLQRHRLNPTTRPFLHRHRLSTTTHLFLQRNKLNQTIRPFLLCHRLNPTTRPYFTVAQTTLYHKIFYSGTY